jgi:hypothetical protein
MTKESIATINGHDYRYRYNQETKLMDYLGPVGDAPSLSQEQFRKAMVQSKIVSWQKGAPKVPSLKEATLKPEGVKNLIKNQNLQLLDTKGKELLDLEDVGFFQHFQVLTEDGTNTNLTLVISPEHPEENPTGWKLYLETDSQRLANTFFSGFGPHKLTREKESVMYSKGEVDKLLSGEGVEGTRVTLENPYIYR